MLLPVKAICQPKDIRKDGTSLIYIQYCYSSEKRTLLNTEIAIPPKFWNKKKECISDSLPAMYGDIAYLNGEIVRMVRTTEDLIAQANQAGAEAPGSYVKERFSPSFEVSPQGTPLAIVQIPQKRRKREPDVFDQIDDYIKSKERKVCPKALAAFKSMKDHLRAYEIHTKQPLRFSSFNFSFYESFVDFLSFDYRLPRLKEPPVFGLMQNTIGKTIKQLRIFIRDRIKRKIITPIDLSDFKILGEEADAIYLSFEEIGSIYRVDLSEYQELLLYRDLFVLACLTGLRFSDISTLRSGHLRGDMLFKKQVKTDQQVVIPMRPDAKEIFLQLFSGELSAISNPLFNRYIKTIGELAGINDLVTFSYKKGNKTVEETRPKHKWITTHTARRSFCTNEFLAGDIPVKLIMAISGHKTEANFYRYIRISAEEAANKIQELWQQRGSITHLLNSPAPTGCSVPLPS